jgi:hypothetical protein
MSKKELKFYESPETEILEVEEENALLDVSIDQGEDIPLD